MSTRKSEFQNENPNPAHRFLEWKSEKKCFSYYDKEIQKNVEVPLPLTFLTLKEMHTVKGWNDASESAIFSNEVKYIGNETLNVRSFKGGDIAKGLYKDIRTAVKDAGGHYVKSIYIMTKDGEIWNVQLKGSAVQSWGEFTNKSRTRLSDEWVTVYDAEDRKKGRINYTVPLFKFDTSLSTDEGSIADQVYATLDMYMKAYLASKPEQSTPPVSEDNEVFASLEDDDLPF